MCLTKRETDIVYNCLQTGMIITPALFDNSVAHHISKEYATIDNILDKYGSINPYETLLLPDTVPSTPPVSTKIDCKPTYSQWSILSTTPSYCGHPPVYLHITSGPPDLLRRTVATSPITLRSVAKPQPAIYLDRFSEVTASVHSSDQFNDEIDVTTTYLGPDKVCISDVFFPELHFPVYSNSHTHGYLHGVGMINILVDTGAHKSYMSKRFFDKSPGLHSLRRLPTVCSHLRVGDGYLIRSHFILPIVVKIFGHRFEIFTLVADLQEKDELVLGLKNMFELEGEYSCRSSEFRFLNRSIPIFPLSSHTIKPGARRTVKAFVPFLEYFSGMGIAKFTLGRTVYTILCQFQDNMLVIDVTNTSDTSLFYTPNISIGIVDIRSLGYYFVKHHTLHFHLSQEAAHSPYNHVEHPVCKQTTLAHSQQSADPPAHPWLASDDPRLHMTDRQILDTYINLENCVLDESEKVTLRDMIYKYKAAFSLRDEIGRCPDFTVKIDTVDPSPFFVRPFPISEDDKPIMDRQMERLVSLGILSRNTASHTSPVMLITRKVTNDKRPIVDFRLLNSRIRRQNTSTPLLRDIHQMLGRSNSDVLSVADLKDAFHSLPLDPESKEFCGILPYFGSPHYRYEVMPMGLSISPCQWIQYIGYVMDKIPHKDNYIAIMDDLLVHSPMASHMDRLEDLFKSLIAHGLKISPKKCQFFKTELVYMGNVFRCTRDGIKVSPIKTRVDAILSTPPPRTVKQCKSFCGVVNYLSLFCPNLQRHLAPIYDLTRKGTPFHWTPTHQSSFDTVKSLLAQPPVLSLPDSTGRFLLYTDTSKTHVGSALWQYQKGTPRLLGYASKSLSPAAQNYSITELEMTGLLKGMQLWQYYLGKKDFDACVDHRAIAYIVKSKKPPATNRIIALLEKLSEFNYNLYYVKGKDMILSDFLSRHSGDTEDPHCLVPVAYNSATVLRNLSTFPSYSVITRAARRAAGLAAPPAVHGVKKSLDPHVRPEHDKITSPKKVQFQLPTVPSPLPESLTNSPSILPLTPAAPKSILKHNPHTPHSLGPSTPVGSLKDKGIVSTSKPHLVRPSIDRSLPIPKFQLSPTCGSPVNVNSDGAPNSPLLPLAPKAPTVPPSTKLPEAGTAPIAIVPDGHGLPLVDPNQDVPYQDTSLDAMFSTPEWADFIMPQSLESLNGKSFVAKKMPSQAQIDKLLSHLNRKILRDTRLPLTMKDIAASYLSSTYFKDIYLYHTQGQFPSLKRKATRLRTLADDFFVLGSLLFKYRQHPTDRTKLTAVLCVPPSKIDLLLDYYHGTILGGHHGISKTVQTLSQRFFCPRMADYIRSYIVGCHICQLFKDGKRFARPFHCRMYDISVPALSKVSMDIKYMPASSDGSKFLLVIICEISNFLVTHAMKSLSATVVTHILVDYFISYFGAPTQLVCDQDPVFLATITQYCMSHFRMKLLTVSPTNHKSLMAEHGIKSLANLIKTHLTGLGQDWHFYAKPCMLAYNSYCTPNLANLSPFELVFGRPANIAPDLEMGPSVPVTGTFKKAKEVLDKKLLYLRRCLVDFRQKRQEEMNANREPHSFFMGQLVYLFFPGNSILTSSLRKFTCKFLGPLVVWKCISPTQFILMSLDGIVYPFLIEETRLKPALLHTSKGNVNCLSDLRSIVKAGFLISKKPFN